MSASNRPRQRWVRGCLIVLLLALSALGAAFVTLVAPAGEASWSWRLPLSRDTGVSLRVAPLLRLASSSLGRRLLDGTRWQVGGHRLAFADRDGGLDVRCAPCAIHWQQLSAQPLRLASLRLVLRREGGHLLGRIAADAGSGERIVDFHGDLEESGIELSWRLPADELSQWLGLARSVIPELEYAQVAGRFSAHGTLQLPGGRWTVVPVLEGFEVYGLGTERLRHGGMGTICRNESGAALPRLTGDGVPGWLPLDKIGRFLPRAVLAAEDANFYQHPGYDLAELGPLLANAERNDRRGASTLTQQLAKNMFVGADRTLARKLRELLYAVEMERTLGKRRILLVYLNTVDWGPGLCGATQASQHYFGRPPAKLTPAEAAWLAGILRNPRRAYQQEFMTRSVEAKRQEWVLEQMHRRRNPGSFVFASTARP